MNYGNITITLTDQDDGIRIQGTCEELSDTDVIKMLEITISEIKDYGLMLGLHNLNSGYFETLIEK
jgi:hypothetical protein